MADEHPLGHWFMRAVAVSLVWVGFAAIGFWVYVNYIHDVGATFWVMQVFLLPAVLPLVMLFDFLLRQRPVMAQRFGLVTALDGGYALMFWRWPLWALGVLLAMAVVRLLQSARLRRLLHLS